METVKYQVEMTDERTRWSRDGREFDSYFEAAMYALLLIDQSNRFDAIGMQVRVVAA